MSMNPDRNRKGEEDDDDDTYDFDNIAVPRFKVNRVIQDASEPRTITTERNVNSRKQETFITHPERPMTAMSGAGYRKHGTNQSGCHKDLEQHDDTVTISSKTRKFHTGTDFLIWEKELEINNLIEQSTTQLYDGNLKQALDLAQQAGKKERLYLNYIQSKSITLESSSQLSFATWFNLATMYEKNDMLEEAIQAFMYLNKQKKFHAFSGIVRVQLGNIYYNQRSYGDAIKMYEMATDIFSRDNREMSGKISAKIGNAYAKQGNFQLAIHHYESAVRLCSDLEPTFNLLLCHGIKRNVEEVKKIFLKLASATGKGYVQSCIHRYQRAASGLESFLQDPLEEYLMMLSTKRTGLLLSAAHILILTASGRNKTETFNWIYNQLNDHFPEIASKVEMNNAMDHIYNYRFDSGSKILKSFEKQESDVLSLAAVNLSCLYFLEKNIGKANIYADMALKRNRFNAMALVNKGNVFFSQQDIEFARDFYKEALNIHSTCPEALYNLGLSLIRLGHDEDAVVVFERLHTISPSDPSVLFQVAAICERQQKWAITLKWLNILCTRVPTDKAIEMKIHYLLDKLGSRLDKGL